MASRTRITRGERTDRSDAVRAGETSKGLPTTSVYRGHPVYRRTAAAIGRVGKTSSRNIRFDNVMNYNIIACSPDGNVRGNRVVQDVYCILLLILYLPAIAKN